MKKLISCLLTLVLLFSMVPVAFAATGGIEEAMFNYGKLKADVAVGSTSDVTFYASVDGRDQVEVKAEEMDPAQIGHIIVVDLAFAWTSQITDTNDIIPALNAYMTNVESGQQVMFILAGNNSTQPTTFMTKDKASLFISNSIKLPEKATGQAYQTTIDGALKTAFTIAANPDEGPLFKQVFALVDPANPGLGYSATDVRNDYKKSGNAFPVLIAPIYPQTYMKDYGDRPSAERVNKGMTHYQSFAQSNDSVIATLNSTHKQGINTSSLSAMMSPRAYYTLDLTPIHTLIDYSKDEHEIELAVANSRGTQVTTLYKGISTSVLPDPAYTPTPEPTEQPTPDPYMVRPGDATQEAKLAIVQLYELYYIQADGRSDLPGSYDESCEYAFMEFCKQNGLPREGTISVEAYQLLMSDDAIPYPTPTPLPEAVTPTPSPSPTPVPRIYIGANSTSALRAISKLKELYYLDDQTRYSAWDGECMMAFQNLCADNGMVYNEEYLDDAMYDWLINGKLNPKVTPTPVPSDTPVPEITVPPQGYVLGDQDTDDVTFIAQMQAVLQRLNLYTAETTMGTLDQPTLDAIAMYCQVFNMSMKAPDSVERTIVNDILTNGANREVPTTPAPSVSERFTSFLQKDALYLGNFAVKMWMLLVLVVVLLFALLLIIILTNRGRSHTDVVPPMPPMPPQPPQPGGGGNGPAVPAPGGFSGGGSSYDSDVTVPMGHGGQNFGDDDQTVKLGSGINVTLSITGGPSADVKRVLIGQNNFVIGRRSKNGTSECDLVLDGDSSVSRKHAALSYRDKQLMLFNLSSNGTSVNGQPVGDTNQPIESDVTVPLGGMAHSGPSGFVLKHNDTIEISGYRITVNW